MESDWIDSKPVENELKELELAEFGGCRFGESNYLLESDWNFEILIILSLETRDLGATWARLRRDIGAT